MRSGRSQLVLLLLDVEVGTAESALFTAVDCGKLDVARVLLKSGADVQATWDYDDEIITPLEVALRNSNIELIRLLLDGGAHISESAFCEAVRLCNLDVAKLSTMELESRAQ